MPYLNPKIEIKSSKKSGRGYYATENLPAGTTILTEYPIVQTICSKYSKSFCDYCCKPTKKICKACNKFAYCNVKCQKAAWNAYHKIECKLLKNLDFKKLTDGLHIDFGDLSDDVGSNNLMDWIIFLGRVIILRADETKFPQVRQSVENLCSNFDSLSPGGQEHLYNLSNIFMRYFTETNFKKYCSNSLNAKKMLNLMSALKCNMFVSDNEDISLQSFSLCLYPKTAITNHSCDYNSNHVFYDMNEGNKDLLPKDPIDNLRKGNLIAIKLNRNVEKGQEITINYNDTRQDVATRREVLKTVYTFDCDCTRCGLDSKQTCSRQKQINTRHQNIGLEFISRLDKGDFEEIHAVIKFLNKEFIPLDNLITVTLNEYVFDFYLKSAESELDEKFRDEFYTKAVLHGTKAVEGGNLLDFNDILHGLTTLKVTKLLVFLKEYQSAEVFLKLAYDILVNGYDEKYGSQVLKCVEELRYEINHCKTK